MNTARLGEPTRRPAKADTRPADTGDVWVPPRLRLLDLPPSQHIQVPAAPLPEVEPLLQVKPRALDAWRAFRELRDLSQVIYPSGVNHRFAKRARFMYRAMADLPLWLQWRGFLDSSPFVEIARDFPRLYEKPLRPYLHKDLMHAETVRVLREHYLFLQRRAPGRFVRCLLDNRPFMLNERSVGGLEQPLLLNLSYARHMQQEGELTLSLGLSDSLDTLQDHRWICALTFLLQYGVSGWEILVGGIQGGHSDKSREEVRLATHVFHGLRPKHLLIHLLREIASAWGVSHIYAVSDAAHCLRSARYRGRIKFMSSYDELWREVEGQPVDNGFYSLPVKHGRRPLEEVPSRKRSQHRKRYALMDSIDAEIREKLMLP